MGKSTLEVYKSISMPKKYSREPAVKGKAVKAAGTDVRVSFKNTWNTANAIKGMALKTAKKYLEQCLERQRCIPQRKFCGSTGRTGQAKEFGVTKGRWPTKSINVVLGLVKNMLANANARQLDSDNLNIEHVQVNAAPNGRRRTYRAHGRITPFMSCPCHIEMWAVAKDKNVTKAKAHTGTLSRVQAARARTRQRLAAGESN